MKVSFAVACLISNTSAVKLRTRDAGPWEYDASATPWDKGSLPDCPADGGRTIMDDGKTHVSKYPNVGATCKVQKSAIASESLVQFLDSNAVQVEQDPAAGAFAKSVQTLEHCPDFNERFTLKDGRTKGVPYPEIGFNCNGDYQLVQKRSSDPNWGPSVNSLQKCPDFDERMTLTDGQTKAVAYPAIGYNCNNEYQLVQKRSADPNWGPSVNSLQKCPDFDERMTLTDGQTKAVAYPAVGYNCNNEYQLVQKRSADPNWGPSVNSLQKCPDFDERMTLTDGQTKAVAYPAVGYNCNNEYQLVQKRSADPNWGPSVNSLQKCPDFDERMTLTDGQTKAVAYPAVGYNCNNEYQLVQKKSADPNWGPSVNSLQKCPDFDERMTLTDGQTKAIAYPAVGYNCNNEYQLAQKQDPNWGPSVNSLQKCPDFDERMTLTDGQTKAIAYPAVGYNCNNEYQLAQKQDPNWGPSVNSLQHCPDFDERFTLTDGKTKAVPFPEVGFNCNANYQLHQKKVNGKDIGSDIAGLQHCPDFDERFTLVDGKTMAIAYPAPGYNCSADYAVVQKDHLRI